MFRFPIYPNLTFLNSSRLQPVLIYHQFAGADATTFANVMKIPVFTIGGQHGVIAEDRFPNRAGAQEGTPSFKNFSDLFPASAAMTERICYVIYISKLFNNAVTKSSFRLDK